MKPNTTIDLSGSLSLERAETVSSEILSSLQPEENGVSLNLASVNDCDTAGLQVLLSLRSTLKNRGGELELKNVPEQVATCAARLGLGDEKLFSIH